MSDTEDKQSSPSAVKMSETAELIAVMREQMKLQAAQLEAQEQHRREEAAAQEERRRAELAAQEERRREELAAREKRWAAHAAARENRMAAVVDSILKKEEEATEKSAMKTVHHTSAGTSPGSHPVHKVHAEQGKVKKAYQPRSMKAGSQSCRRCKGSHSADACRFKNATCHFCRKRGHIEAACYKKKNTTVQKITRLQGAKTETKPVKAIRENRQPTMQLQIKGHQILFEIDTGAGDNFISEQVWKQLGSPHLSPTSVTYQSASQHALPTLGMCSAEVKVPSTSPETSQKIQFVVTSVSNLNLLGLDAIHRLSLSLDDLLRSTVHSVHTGTTPTITDTSVQEACVQVCQEYPEVFREELGCLKDVELEVQFKAEAKPKFCKPRPVPFALQEELNQALDVGIQEGIWEPVQFNTYGTPVVPVRKQPLPGKAGKLRVCGDYAATVNPQLETHRQPLPLPEDLMRRLGGGHGFSKIDLANAYNQIALGPESQKRLALSTHRGVLQKRLPFGISSAPGYFQNIMEQITGDLQGVAVYLDDILVSGDSAADHVNNLRRLLARLQETGLRCRLEKCEFAKPSVEYLGHHLSKTGISKGKKSDAVREMPTPKSVSELRSFLGAVQFYSKFLQGLATVTEPLHRLTRRDTTWSWGEEQERAFCKLKEMLEDDTVLAHFDPSLPLGISCDASEVGIGAVLFHRWSDGRERPIANISKTLTKAQKRYSQVQKEALAIVFALKKFHQFLYGRRFILVTDHKPLLVLFGPDKETPALAANRLARWALTLSQYEYDIEYRKTTDHGNADALSRLPVGPDRKFDEEEDVADTDTVCTIKTISLQLSPTDPGVLRKESTKDPVISTVMRHVQEGWPQKGDRGDNEEDKDNQSYKVKTFKSIASSLSVAEGCLLYGARVVVPLRLQSEVLNILHLGHFGIQRMKQLARTAVYWPGVDGDITKMCQQCTACGEHQNSPSKAPNHPWMLPEKPWSRVHVDHAINFCGRNWLIMVDALSKYPCIHETSSTSTKATTDLLEVSFAHFGYPHAIVSDNATTFTSEEFQGWCKERGIAHLTGAPYHPATNGAGERMVQTFKQSMKKSKLPPKAALQEFLMMYRRTPLEGGYAPSQLLNGRQIRTRIDTLLPSPVHAAQQKQAREATKSQNTEQQQGVSRVSTSKYSVGTACYALYCGPRRNKQARWVPATVVKVMGSRHVRVKVYPRGPTWRRHIEQLKPRHSSNEDGEPGEFTTGQEPSNHEGEIEVAAVDAQAEGEVTSQRPQPQDDNVMGGSTARPEYGPGNLRRSKRKRKRRIMFNI